MITRVLHVYGRDYAPEDFQTLLEAGTIIKEQVWEDSWMEVQPVEVEDDIMAMAYQFGDIDPKFIRFIRNEIVKDRSEDSDFIII